MLWCLAIAALSLPLRAWPSFDPWAWLVWGREAVRLELVTSGGPSWKPLPVLVTAVLAPLGDLAVPVWMVVARASALLAFVATYRLAKMLAGPLAGVLAGALLVLTPGGGSRMFRLIAEGHADPAAATLCLWAIERHLAGRRRLPLVLLVLAGLLRPEVWPFLVFYAAWLWRAAPEVRTTIGLGLAAVPVLWFGGDWWGSGSPLHGADAAQVAEGTMVDRLLEAGDRVLRVVVVPAWPAAALALAWVRRRGVAWWFAGLAVAWFAVVVAMAVVLRYAALNRFLLPGAALVCVLAGAAVVAAIGRVRSGAARWAVAATVLAVSAPFALPRLEALPDVVDEAAARAELGQDLESLVDSIGGAGTVAACDHVAVDNADLAGPTLTALAWHLDLPLARVGRRARAGGIVFAQPGGTIESRLLAESPAPLTEVGRTARWVAYSLGCNLPDISR